MLELSEKNVAQYLRDRGQSIPAEGLLVQSLSGGLTSVVLKVFNPAAGAKLGTDLRSPAQIEANEPDTRPAQGECFILKQPLPKFQAAAEWLVDIDRTKVERDAMVLLSHLLPAGSVPEVLWFDETNYILCMSCAPTDAVLWKQQLLTGTISTDAAQHAGMLLAMIHSGTRGDIAVAARYGEPKLFIQQRTDAYLKHLLIAHPDLAGVINPLVDSLLNARHCLIHGDFSPKNMFLVPRSNVTAPTVSNGAQIVLGRGRNPRFFLSHLLLIDFEVCFYGHCGFDVATLINHLLLKSFYNGRNWRACMIAIDAFWQTYQHAVDPQLAKIAEATAGHILGALLLARVDGKSPAEYITDPALKELIRQTACKILTQPNASLETALEIAGDALSTHKPVHVPAPLRR